MTNAKINTIDVHELKKRMDSTPDLCLIDVREQNEWQEVRIPKALHMPKDTILSSIAQQVPNKEQAIYLHCKGGIRSLYAAQCLIDAGYENVYSIDGGIMDWAMHGYPIEQ